VLCRRTGGSRHCRRSGRDVTILEVVRERTRRLGQNVLRDDQGRRAVFGDDKTLQTDPHVRDDRLFYEYFHGDTGRGVGASHQTGWSGVIATRLQPQRGDTDRQGTRQDGADVRSSPQPGPARVTSKSR
jgi:hypothetical protein